MLEEKYKAKVEDMQIYVPLLTKLITKLEAKNDTSEENIEKISQLKILLQQLLDPKPGISFEELNECHQVMKNLFKSNKNDVTKLKSQTTENNEIKDANTTKTVNITLQNVKKSLSRATKNGENQKNIPEKHEPQEQKQQISEELIKSNSLDKDKNYKTEEDRKTHEVLEKQIKEADKFEMEATINVNNIKPLEQNGKIVKKEEISINIIKETVKQVQTTEEDDYEAFGVKTRNNELENVEVIEFSEEESDASFEDEEMILPDNEEELLFVDPRENFKKNEKDENSENEGKSENDEGEEIKTDGEMHDEVQPNMQNEDLKKENKKIQIETDEGTGVAEKIKETESDKNNRNSYNEVQPYELLDAAGSTQPATENVDDDEELMDLDNLSDSKQGATKRANSQSDASEIPALKKVKSWDLVNDIEIEEAMETVSALANNFVDPLAVEDLSLVKTTKNIEEPVFAEMENKNVAAENNDDDVGDEDDDDVEIIETRNSPILIDSEEEDMVYDNDVVKSDTPVALKPITLPTKTLAQQQPVQQTRKIIISNVTSLRNKLKDNLQATKPSATQKIPNISATVTSRLLQQQQRSNNDLQPNMISGPNPQLFSAKVGSRNLLIPNAFYGSTKKVSAPNPDIAHCRWLENFLYHFCSPFNIAHNTCFMLLQRAVREEDYLRIRQDRLLLNITKGEIDHELLEYMRQIFYVNGDHVAQKLSFIGRKFCNLAFVNILDKTISLTVDWRTNGVTSRTRISAATLEAARGQKSPMNPIEIQAKSVNDVSNSFAANAVALKPTAPIPMQTPNIIFPTTITYPPTTTQTSNCLPAKELTPVRDTSTLIVRTQKVTKATKIPMTTSNDEDDVEYIPIDNDINMKIIHENSAEVKPRRSLRSGNRPEKVEITNRFIYSDDENDVGSNTDGADHEFLPEKEEHKSSTAVKSKRNKQDLDQIDLAAFVNDLVSNKHSTIGKTEQEKKTKSFEMAFLERLAHEDKDAFARAKRKVSAMQIASNKDQTIVLIDDDEDKDVSPKTTAKLPLDPRLATDKADQIERQKNTDAGVHLKGKHNNFCLVCRRKVNHIVGHYVNMHPDCEVFVSRPTAKYAALLMKNRLPMAKYERERNNLSLFLATCVFCEKKGSFTFSYWYQHFASHTGEYAYQCSGCGIRKPSRSLLVAHLPSCPKKGLVETKQQYDCLLTKISAFMCRICHYTQMNSVNIMKHLKCEHDLESVIQQVWCKVTLLMIPPEYARDHATTDVPATTQKKAQVTSKTKAIRPSTSSDTQTSTPIIIRDSNGDIFEIAEVGDGKSYAVDLTANIDPPPFIVNEVEEDSYGANLYNSQMDEIGDVEGIIQAYINRKT